MRVSFLITDGGPHPADKLAASTAGRVSDLIELLPNASEGTTLAKAEFEVAVMRAMLKAHKDAQQHERVGIHSDGDKRLSDNLAVEPFLQPAFDAVISATKGTAFEAHFAQENVQAVVRQMIGGDLATAMHTERSWHADGKHISRRTGKEEPLRGNDPNNKHRLAWLARHRPADAPAA